MRAFDRTDYSEDSEADVGTKGINFPEGFVCENKDELQRRLGNRQIQLLAIGGSIGTMW